MQVFRVPPPFFPRPPYLEHTAFRSLFKQDLFSRNPQPPPLSTASSSSSSSKPTPSRSAPGVARRTASLYSSSYLQHISGTSTPSPGASDVEDNDYGSLPTARPRDNRPQKVTIRPEEESFTLPTRWNESDRHASLQISADGRDLTFLGSQGELSIETVRPAFQSANLIGGR